MEEITDQQREAGGLAEKKTASCLKSIQDTGLPEISTICLQINRQKIHCKGFESDENLGLLFSDCMFRLRNKFYAKGESDETLT